MENNDKFAAMLGFARRARKAVYGYDTIRGVRHPKLLAVSSTAADNLKDNMRALAERHGVPLVTVDGLEELAGSNCKALAITDGNMARAMSDYARSGAPRYKI